ISPVFGTPLVPDSLHASHFLNPFVICSPCIPAYLLVRRVSGRAAAAWFAAVATLCVPWLVLSSFLLTEVAAYPAFLWAVFALQLASDDPSWRHDMLALPGIARAGPA